MSAQVLARTCRVWLAAVAFAGGACSHDWDFFDPRLGSGGQSTGGAPVGGSPGNGGGGASGGEAPGGAPSGGAPAGGGGQGGAAGGGGAGPTTLEYTATVADCISPVNPDPDACAAENGGSRMTADIDVDMTGQRQIFMRFDLDAAIGQGTVSSVVLRLTVPVFVGSESNQSGALFEVAPFTRADLFDAPPAQVGAGPLVADLGPVVQGQVVDFELAPNLVSPNDSLYFRLSTTSTNGVDYFNLTGTSPPELLVTVE